MIHKIETESACARGASAIRKFQINGAVRSVAALTILGFLTALALQGCSGEAESKPAGHTMTTATTTKMTTTTSTTTTTTTTTTSTTTSTTTEVWSAAPTDISDVKHDLEHFATSLKDAGLDGVTLPARENFVPLGESSTTEAKSFLSALKEAGKTFHFGGESRRLTSLSRKLQTPEPIELTTEPTAKFATLDDLPDHVEKAMSQLFDTKGTRIVMWSQTIEEERTWQVIIQANLRRGADMNKLGNGTAKWMEGLRSSVTASVFVVSTPVMIDGNLIQDGLSVFADVDFESVGIIAQLYDLLKPVITFGQPTAVELKARENVARLSPTSQMDRFLDYPEKAKLLRINLPPADGMGVNLTEGSGSIELPDMRFAMPTGASIDIYGLVLLIEGFHAQPVISLGGHYIVLFDANNASNAFYGSVHGVLEVGGSCTLQGSVKQLGDLPEPMTNMLKVMEFQAKYTFPLTNTSDQTKDDSHANNTDIDYVSLGVGWCTDDSGKDTNGYQVYAGHTENTCKLQCSSDSSCIGYTQDTRGWCHLHAPNSTRPPQGWVFVRGQGGKDISTVDEGSDGLVRNDWKVSSCMKKVVLERPIVSSLSSGPTRSFQAFGKLQVGDVKETMGGFKVDVSGLLMMQWTSMPDGIKRDVAAMAQTSEFDLGGGFCWLTRFSLNDPLLPCPSNLGFGLPSSFQPKFTYASEALTVVDFDGEQHYMPQGVSFQNTANLGSMPNSIPGEMLSWLGLENLETHVSILQSLAVDTKNNQRRLSVIEVPPHLRLNGPAVDITLTPASGPLKNISLFFISSACRIDDDDDDTALDTPTACVEQVRSIAATVVLDLEPLPKFEVSTSIEKPMSGFNGLTAFVLEGKLLEPWTNVAGFQQLHIYDAGVQLAFVSRSDFSIKAWAHMQFTKSLAIEMTLIFERGPSESFSGTTVSGYMLVAKVPWFSLWNIMEFVNEGNDADPAWLTRYESSLKQIGAAVDLKLSTGVSHMGEVYPPGHHVKLLFNFLGNFAAYFDVETVVHPQIGLTSSVTIATSNLDVSGVFHKSLDFAQQAVDKYFDFLEIALDSLLQKLVSFLTFDGIWLDKSDGAGLLAFAQHPHKCLDVKGGSSTNGNSIILYDCEAFLSDDLNRMFIVPSDTAVGQIRWARNKQKCLDVVNGRSHNGNRIQLWDCQPNNRNQLFILPSGDTGHVRWAAEPSKCMEVKGRSTDNKAAVELWDCHPHMTWTLPAEKGCPATCQSPQCQDMTFGGKWLVDDKCEHYCSREYGGKRYCGSADDGYYTNGGIDCRGCKNSHYKICSNLGCMGLAFSPRTVIQPVQNFVDAALDVAKASIPEDSFRVNKLAFENFGLGAVLQGAATNFALDVDFLGGFNVNFTTGVDWAFLQPVMQGMNNVVSEVIQKIKDKGQELLSEMGSFLAQKACETINNVCMTVSAGQFFDANLWFFGHVRIPSQNIHQCLKTYLPPEVTGCGRKLSPAPGEAFLAEICMEGVQNGHEPKLVQHPPPSWHPMVPVPNERIQSNATHTTYCFLAEPLAVFNEAHRRMSEQTPPQTAEALVTQRPQSKIFLRKRTATMHDATQ